MADIPVPDDDAGAVALLVRVRDLGRRWAGLADPGCAGPTFADEVLAQDLPCWHSALHVARTTRWDPCSGDPGSPFYRRGGWLGSGLPVPQPLEVSPGAFVCAGCHETLTGDVR